MLIIDRGDYAIVRQVPDPGRPGSRRSVGLTRRQVWTWPTAVTTGDPAVQRVELSVGDATRALSPAQVRQIIAALAA